MAKKKMWLWPYGTEERVSENKTSLKKYIKQKAKGGKVEFVRGTSGSKNRMCVYITSSEHGRYYAGTIRPIEVV